MSLQIPSTGLQLEEDFTGSLGHLPTQAFILDLSDDVIEGLIAAADRGEELSISLGKKPVGVLRLLADVLVDFPVLGHDCYT